MAGAVQDGKGEEVGVRDHPLLFFLIGSISSVHHIFRRVHIQSQVHNIIIIMIFVHNIIVMYNLKHNITCNYYYSSSISHTQHFIYSRGYPISQRKRNGMYIGIETKQV